MILTTFISLNASEKIYIDEDELSVVADAFHIHLANTIWIETNTIHRGITGRYIFENNIKLVSGNGIRKRDIKRLGNVPTVTIIGP